MNESRYCEKCRETCSHLLTTINEAWHAVCHYCGKAVKTTMMVGTVLWLGHEARAMSHHPDLVQKLGAVAHDAGNGRIVGGNVVTCDMSDKVGGRYSNALVK